MNRRTFFKSAMAVLAVAVTNPLSLFKDAEAAAAGTMHPGPSPWTYFEGDANPPQKWDMQGVSPLQMGPPPDGIRSGNSVYFQDSSGVLHSIPATQTSTFKWKHLTDSQTWKMFPEKE